MNIESTATPVDEPIGEVTEGNYEVLFESSQARVKELETIIAAGKLSQTQTPKDDSRPILSSERVKGMLGQHVLNGMDHGKRLASLGLAPDAYSREFLLKTFGRGADGSIGNELFRTSPRKYREAREAALITGAYGSDK